MRASNHARNTECISSGLIAKMWQCYEAYNDYWCSFSFTEMCGMIWKLVWMINLPVFSELNPIFFLPSMAKTSRHPGINHCVIIAWHSHTTYQSLTPLASLWAFLGSKYWNSLYLNIHHLCTNEFLFACKPSSAFPNGRAKSIFGPELEANATEAHIISQTKWVGYGQFCVLGPSTPSFLPNKRTVAKDEIQSPLQWHDLWDKQIWAQAKQSRGIHL